MEMELVHNWNHEEEFELIKRCILKSYNSEVHSQSLVEGILELAHGAATMRNLGLKRRYRYTAEQTTQENDQRVAARPDRAKQRRHPVRVPSDGGKA